ncbi:MAG: DUF4276 family protein [Magnetococcales bacterium]|nr:DUF4276 family protein [Magnetococcales bacterium]
MVKVGFVVEGASEKVFLESSNFRNWASQNGIFVCDPIINAEGNGNLCQKNLSSFVEDCRTKAEPEFVLILADLECDPCVAATKMRVGNDGDAVCLAKKALESWFLADAKAMEKWLGKSFSMESPEEMSDLPWNHLKKIADRLNTAGPGKRKLTFAKRMINYYDFSIERAARHPACPSATYFLDTLKRLAQSSGEMVGG